MTELVDIRVRTVVPDSELAAKVGKIVTPGDYNVLLTGPTRVRKPDGSVLCVYLPGVLADAMADVFDVLHSIRLITDNRGMASGTPRERRGQQKRTRTRNIASGVLGAVDPGPSSSSMGTLPACRLTAWTGKHLPEWHRLRPLLQLIAAQFAEHVPERYAIQADWAAHTHPDWVVPGTPFTTITVNNTYSTGVHQDAGDLQVGFSTLSVCRRGAYTGGAIVLPRFRVAVDMQDGDLLLFDAHEWHGNVAMRCPHTDSDLAERCPEGCERVSIVAYYRTKVRACESAEAEAAKAVAFTES